MYFKLFTYFLPPTQAKCATLANPKWHLLAEVLFTHATTPLPPWSLQPASQTVNRTVIFGVRF